MTEHFNPNVPERTNEFRNAQSGSSTDGWAHFVQDMQKDAQAAKAGHHGHPQAAYNELYRNELKPLNDNLKDVLPKLHISGTDSEQAQIMGLTAEKGEKKGLVLAADVHDGKANQVVILTNEGRYMEAEKTRHGYIAKEGGKEYERNSEGVLDEKKHVESTSDAETRLSSEVIDLLFKISNPDNQGQEEASRELHKLATQNPKDAQTLEHLLERYRQQAEDGRESWFDNHMPKLKFEHDEHGVPFAVRKAES